MNECNYRKLEKIPTNTLEKNINLKMLFIRTDKMEKRIKFRQSGMRLKFLM